MPQITAKKFAYPWLAPPDELAGTTVLDVLRAESAEEHRKWVEEWARAVWVSWSMHHALVEEWLKGIR